MFDKIIKYVVIGLLIISVAGNVFLLIKSKIVWNVYNTANSQSYSNSASASINLNFLNNYYNQQGQRIIWKKYIVEKDNLDKFLNDKNFIFSLFSKIIEVNTIEKGIFINKAFREYWVIIPEVVEVKK